MFVQHSHPGIKVFDLVGDAAFDSAESVVHLMKSRINLLESRIDLLESRIDLLESRIDFATKRCDLARQCLQDADGVLESRYSFFQGSSCHRASGAPASREACAEGRGAKQADDVSIVVHQPQSDCDYCDAIVVG